MKQNGDKVFNASEFQVERRRKEWIERAKTLIGTRFNSWTIISDKTELVYYGKYKSCYRQVHCRCDCGEEKMVYLTLLQRNKSTCCLDCAHKKSLDQYEFVSNTYFTRLKAGAKKRKFDFEITYEYLEELFVKQQGLCALSGVPIGFLKCSYYSRYNRKNNEKQTASLDRIDSSKGYIEGNVQWVHCIVNKMKLDLDQDDFLVWCYNILQHNNLLKND